MQVQTLPYAQLPVRRTNVMSIVALVAVFFVGVLAIPLGHIALGQIRRTGEEGHGLAVASLVLGYASLAFVVLLIALAV